MRNNRQQQSGEPAGLASPEQPTVFFILFLILLDKHSAFQPSCLPDAEFAAILAKQLQQHIQEISDNGNPTFVTAAQSGIFMR